MSRAAVTASRTSAVKSRSQRSNFVMPTPITHTSRLAMSGFSSLPLPYRPFRLRCKGPFASGAVNRPSVEVVPSVHVESLAADRPRQVGGEEDDRRRNLVRVRDVIEGRAGGDLGVDRLGRRRALT